MLAGTGDWEGAAQELKASVVVSGARSSCKAGLAQVGSGLALGPTWCCDEPLNAYIYVHNCTFCD